jgi:glycosyltransferase involved in cell wall biosynthesis
MLSFIVPAHNEEHELPATLGAIVRAADAAGERYEIVVVNDDSTDRTADVARMAGARVVPVHLRQISAVRNAGARAARGDVFFFVDADTHISATHVSAALAELTNGAVGGSARVRFDGEIPLWARIFVRAFSVVYFSMNLGVGAFMFARRETFMAAGGFDEQWFAGEEAYLSMALKKLGRFKILREPIVTSARKIRMHPAKVVLAQSFFIFFGGQRALRKRQKLNLWYDGKREQRPAL